MKWLESQVRPTVKVLLEHYTQDDIIEALGLDSRFSKERDGP
jgi:hypothetical protein